MTPIHLAWVPFGLAIGLFVVSTVAVLVVQLVRYPLLGRFSALYDRDAEIGKYLNLRVVLFGWGSLLLGFGFSGWSLFRFTLLLDDLFVDLEHISDAAKFLSVIIPFLYVLIPYQLMRFSTAMVFLAVPQDYPKWQQQSDVPLRWGFSARQSADPVTAAFWHAIDTAMTLIILFFTPSAFKWVISNVSADQQPWMMLLIGGIILLGSFVLSLRSDKEAWESGHIVDALLLLGKIAVMLILFVLVTTLAEVDLIEVALFTVFAVWIGMGSFLGNR